MASEAIHDRLLAAIVRDLRYVVFVDRLHHREHQPRRSLLFLVVQIPLVDHVTESAAHAE